MVDGIIDQYREFDTSVVADALDDHGVGGVVHGVSPAGPGLTAVGRARPLRFERARADGSTNFPFAMLTAMGAGEMLVVDGVSERLSCWGGRASQLAANAGVAGVVIGGGYRDVAEVRESGFPVFGAAPTPRSGQGRVRVASTDEAVTVDGVCVAPGDVVVADETGVVVVPEAAAEAVAKTAAEVAATERDLEAAIAGGATVSDLRERGQQF
jgi:regulator of RNase E activity RraA